MHVKELLSLTGKVCLVTGGAGRYGHCIVEGLAEADGTVITASRDIEAGRALADRMQAEGLDVHALRLDQAEPEEVRAVSRTIKREFGGLDVLVNNAVARPMRGLEAGTVEQFAESMRVNATGMWDLTRSMIELITERGGGAIINMSSMMGMFGPDLSNYDGTDMGTPSPDYPFHRAGMIGLTKYLARALADRNIRCNCISPGGLLAREIQPDRFLDNYTRKVPVGRMAVDDDIKGLVVFLASRASAYVNGENVLMDGGMHC